MKVPIPCETRKLVKKELRKLLEKTLQWEIGLAKTFIMEVIGFGPVQNHLRMWLTM